MQDSTPERRYSPSLLRITLLQLVVLAVFAAFSLRLWRLSVVAGEEYSEAARENRTRLVRTDAARGVMYDRTHKLLIRNVPRFNALLIPAYLPDDEAAKEAVLQRLHELLDLPLVSDYAPPPYPPYWGAAKLGLREQVREGELYAPYRPIVLRTDLPQETVFAMEEEHLDLPGVLIELDPYREYLTGPQTAQVLGYMGPIPSWATEEHGEEQGYDPDDMIGIAGLEAHYEGVLRGRKGTRTVEVDVAGREVRTIGSQIPPQVRTGHLEPRLCAAEHRSLASPGGQGDRWSVPARVNVQAGRCLGSFGGRGRWSMDPDHVPTRIGYALAPQPVLSR